MGAQADSYELAIKEYLAPKDLFSCSIVTDDQNPVITKTLSIYILYEFNF